MLVVGVDIDGVLVNCTTAEFLWWVEREKGYHGAYARYLMHNDWEEAMQLPSAEISRLYAEFEASPQFPGKQPVAGGQAGVRRLKHELVCELHTITARPHTMRACTLDMLGLFYPDDFDGFHFNGWPTKKELVTISGAGILIEDNYAQACAVASIGNVIMFPGRFNVKLPRHPKVIYLEASRDADVNASDEIWQGIQAAAWREIPDIIRSLRHT